MRHSRTYRPGFTLVELLCVIVVLVILVGLLLPAVASAIRKAREASVSAEIQTLSQALASFHSRYGSYPPSRVLLCEDGNYSAWLSANQSLAPSGTPIADITVSQLAARSLATMRKFWPRTQFSTSGPPVWGPSSPIWYDFNGNGVFDKQPYILDGRQCLVFFLGGIPTYAGSARTGYSFAGGVSGFAKDPTNPFRHAIASPPGDPPNPMFSNNRQPPSFEFRENRLALLPAGMGGGTSFPGYADPNSDGQNPSIYAYFASYGGSYDPNDVNVSELDDDSGKVLSLRFRVGFPTYASGSASAAISAVSPAPNPYTLSPSYSATTGNATYHSPQTFQIISPGADHLYGLGGQYTPDRDTHLPLPGLDMLLDPSGNNVTPTSTLRMQEQDNVVSIHQGRLD